MRKLIVISMLVLFSVLFAACGSAAAPVDTTSTNQVNISVESNPNPAVMGDVELFFTITDANGNPIEGAKVDVSADHIDMTGVGMNGAATEQDSGKYSIKANFQHTGNWKLTVYVRKDGLDYKEDFDYKIQ